MQTPLIKNEMGEVLKRYLALNWKDRDARLESVRSELKAMGFYNLSEDVKESILKEAKHGNQIH